MRLPGPNSWPNPTLDAPARALQGTLTIHGKDFSLGSGLSLSGDKLLGKGMLSGEWLDGTPWTINIDYNGSAATILLVPEPSSLTLLAFGVVAAIRRRRSCPRP